MKLLTPKEWILEYHPDPDNIHECNYNVDYHDEFSEGNFTYPIKEDVAYKLMKQYAEYYHNQLTEGESEEKKELKNISLSDIANLSSFMNDNRMKLKNDFTGTLKVVIESDFGNKEIYIINKYDRNTICKECPYIIYLYLKSENFNL